MKRQMISAAVALTAVVAYGSLTGAQAPTPGPVPPPAVTNEAPNWVPLSRLVVVLPASIGAPLPLTAIAATCATPLIANVNGFG